MSATPSLNTRDIARPGKLLRKVLDSVRGSTRLLVRREAISLCSVTRSLGTGTGLYCVMPSSRWITAVLSVLKLTGHNPTKPTML